MRRAGGLLFPLALLAAACSFDYGAASEDRPPAVPDLVMSEVEYVRVRDGKAVVRLQAEKVERYEKDRRMVVSSPRFSQPTSEGGGGAVGAAASADIQLATGDVSLSGGVVLSVPREEIVIETDRLLWTDEERTLRGESGSPVLVKKADGSWLSGTGFSADARRRSWELTGSVSGTLVEEEEADDAEASR